MIKCLMNFPAFILNTFPPLSWLIYLTDFESPSSHILLYLSVSYLPERKVWLIRFTSYCKPSSSPESIIFSNIIFLRPAMLEMLRSEKLLVRIASCSSFLSFMKSSSILFLLVFFPLSCSIIPKRQLKPSYPSKL